MAKLGGRRGCPMCGDQRTERLRTTDGILLICLVETCRHSWVPCSPGCKGYVLEVPSVPGPNDVPAIRGCAACGVPDWVARTWPGAYRAMAERLIKRRGMVEPA